MPDLPADQTASPPAEHGHAKNRAEGVNRPAGGATVHDVFAGYIQLPNRQWVIFAQFVTHQASLTAATELADQAQAAMAEIASTASEAFGRNP